MGRRSGRGGVRMSHRSSQSCRLCRCRAPAPAPGVRRRTAGFTLIELLIAFTLTGIILMLLFSALHLASRAWDATEGRAERSNDVRVVHNFLRRKLRQAHPAAWHPEGSPGEDKVMEGKGRSISFVAPPPAYLGPRGLHVLTLELETRYGEAGSALVLRWEPYRQAMPRRRLRDKENQAVVAEGIEKLRFRYFGADGPGAEPSWSERWSHPTLLPDLVRVEVVKDGEDWPELVVDLHQ
jgi:general secretion pathway protein J